MNKAIENASAVEVHEEDIVILGVASIETQGGDGAGEPNGLSMGSGISDE